MICFNILYLIDFIILGVILKIWNYLSNKHSEPINNQIKLELSELTYIQRKKVFGKNVFKSYIKVKANRRSLKKKNEKIQKWDWILISFLIFKYHQNNIWFIFMIKCVIIINDKTWIFSMSQSFNIIRIN